MAYQPMIPVQNTGGGASMPTMRRVAEAASQTFEQGTPLTLSSGTLQASAFGGSELVYGVSAEPGHNLSVAGTAEDLSEGTPPNQTSAVQTPTGAWIRDGLCGAFLADDFNVFEVSLKTGQTGSTALITNDRYELAKDATTGFWYVDSTSTGTNDEHCVHIVRINPNDNTKVHVKFAAVARYHN